MVKCGSVFLPCTVVFTLKDQGLQSECDPVQLAGFVKRDKGEENDQFTHLIANLPQGTDL